jgi:hypothetical protein
VHECARARALQPLHLTPLPSRISLFVLFFDLAVLFTRFERPVS